ncbi:LacI family DNA-binding transcriptional regulator [Phaeobacter italicus]|uniref:LacI family DNA-binding transcriptional regulator n=1 Tax=Phaeobacter italicus TaxID=481446 RepID=UPI002FDCD455
MAHKGRKAVTSFDVAERAGVSRSMVSRAFSNSPEISKESRDKVIAAAKELGYRVNYLARGLQTKQSDLVGIVVSALDTPYRSRQVKVTASECIKLGYRPILLTAETPGEVETLVAMLFNYNVAGMIITSAAPSSEIINEARSLSVPVVLINRDSSEAGADTVQTDLEQIGRLAFDMLSRSGGKRFAVIEPETPSYSVTGRAASFRDVCAAAGRPAQTFVAPSQSYDAGYDIGGTIGLSLADLDGIFCSTDLLALGVMDRLRHDWNARIPEDLEVVGFDDIEQAAWKSYDLTTIRQDADEQARLAVRVMSERITDPDREPSHVSQIVTPIFRNTTRRNQ